MDHRFLILIAFLSVFTAPAEASGRAGRVRSFNSAQVKKLSFHRLQILRHAYVQFVRAHSAKRPTRSAGVFWVPSAEAALKGELCFFGGWPSEIVNGKCVKPTAASGSCDAGTFECNPALFPASGGSGTCVPAAEGSYANLTDRCEEASRGGIGDLKKTIDPEKMAELSESVKAFCDANPGYDACGNLAARLEALTDLKIGEYETTASPASGPAPSEPAPTASPTSSSTAAPVAATIGDRILNDCNAMLEKQGLRGAEEALVACPTDGEPLFRNQKDFDALNDSLAKTQFASRVVESALRAKLRALIENELRFVQPPTLPLKNEATLKAYLVKTYPGLKENPRFASAVAEVFAETNREAKAEKLVALDIAAVAAQFNGEAVLANSVCEEIYAEATKRFGEKNWIQRQWTKLFTSDEEKKYFEGAKKKLDAALGRFDSKVVSKDLRHTPHFQDEIFDPTVDHGRECAQNGAYVFIRPAVAPKDIEKGAAELRTRIGKDLSALAYQQNQIASGVSAQIDGVLASYVRSDPALLYSTVKAESDESVQKKLAIAMCDAVRAVYHAIRYPKRGREPPPVRR